MPTRRLPPRPNLEHLKRQARELLAATARGNPTACQRMREFHPKLSDASDAAITQSRLTWSDGLFVIAREHGFSSWARLKAHVEGGQPSGRQPSFLDRIDDPEFRRAVEIIDDGDIEALRDLLDEHPNLVSRHVQFEGENYFQRPALLAFVAENPVRNDALPPNIEDITRLLLERGAASNRVDLNEALGLVASGRVAREAGKQCELITLFVEFGADPDTAMLPAIVHGEFEAARCLLIHDASLTLAVASALGDEAAARRLLPQSNATQRHLALALSAQHGAADILQLLLDAGEDPNRFNPPGAHSHSTPLHQAACFGHEDSVRILLQHGARTDTPDTLWNGTPLGWARHAGQRSTANLLVESSE